MEVFTNKYYLLFHYPSLTKVLLKDLGKYARNKGMPIDYRKNIINKSVPECMMFVDDILLAIPSSLPSISKISSTNIMQS